MTLDPSTSIFESDPIDNVISQKNGNVTSIKWIFLGEFTSMLKNITDDGSPFTGGKPFQTSPGFIRIAGSSHFGVITGATSPKSGPPQRATATDADERQDDAVGLPGFGGPRNAWQNTGCFSVSQNLFVEVWVLRGFLVGGSQFFGGGCFCWEFRVGHSR